MKLIHEANQVINGGDNASIYNNNKYKVKNVFLSRTNLFLKILQYKH